MIIETILFHNNHFNIDLITNYDGIANGPLVPIIFTYFYVVVSIVLFSFKKTNNSNV